MRILVLILGFKGLTHLPSLTRYTRRRIDRDRGRIRILFLLKKCFFQLIPTSRRDRTQMIDVCCHIKVVFRSIETL